MEKVNVKKGKNSKEDKTTSPDKILIFCIDISGSMDMRMFDKTRLESVK
jgi:Mg-chelatase subunit ChlD